MRPEPARPRCAGPLHSIRALAELAELCLCPPPGRQAPCTCCAWPTLPLARLAPDPAPSLLSRPPTEQVFGRVKATLTEQQALDLQTALSTATLDGETVGALAAAPPTGGCSQRRCPAAMLRRAASSLFCGHPCLPRRYFLKPPGDMPGQGGLTRPVPARLPAGREPREQPRDPGLERPHRLRVCLSSPAQGGLGTPRRRPPGRHSHRPRVRAALPSCSDQRAWAQRLADRVGVPHWHPAPCHSHFHSLLLSGAIAHHTPLVPPYTCPFALPPFCWTPERSLRTCLPSAPTLPIPLPDR